MGAKTPLAFYRSSICSESRIRTQCLHVRVACALWRFTVHKHMDMVAPGAVVASQNFDSSKHG